MKNNIGMELFRIVVGISILVSSTQFKPSSAQINLPGDCWKSIGTCQSEAATEQEVRDDCCPVLKEQVQDATMCICGVQPILEMDPALADAVSQLLSMCDLGSSFDAICAGPAPTPAGTKSAPAPVPSLPCWDKVETCVDENMKKSETMPKFNASSPNFNVTEFLCCSTVQEIAESQKPCFCGVTTLLEQQPSMTPDIMQVVARCGVAQSVVDLKDFCKGETLALAPSPGKQTSDSTTALSPATAGNKTADSQEGAANRIMTAGSVSSLLVLLTYLLL